MIWMLFTVMLLAAVVFAALPIYRAEQKVSARPLLVVIAVAGLSAVLYSQLGTPGGQSAGSGEMPSIEEMVASLDARLRQDPDDLAGWKMLGRSYMELRNFGAAIEAFEHAIELEAGADGQTLADLGEALMLRDQTQVNGRATELFESALAISPNNPKALFYAGMAALNRGDKNLAADRWEALLATSPPPNIQEILRPKIAELRGEPVAAAVAQTAPAATVQGLTVAVSLGVGASAVAPADATVFVIARDPDQPSPPIAAVRRKVSELPDEVSIGDADAMIPGRVPSGFARLEIVARVSMSGQPMAQSGDWFGSEVIDMSGSRTVEIVIDRPVP